MTKEQREELKERYKERYDDNKITCGSILGDLNYCHGNVNKVYQEWKNYFFEYDVIMDLCIGYIFGTKAMKKKIKEFLVKGKDGGYYEYLSITHDAENFLGKLMDQDSDYFKAYWQVLVAR